MSMIKRKFVAWSKYGWVGLIIIILALALRGLATNYLPDIHDITPLIWGQAFFEGIQSGWLYPVWLPQIWYGFGLPVFQFYAPLYYWTVALFQSMGLDVLYATKIVLGLSLMGGWWFMYLWAREFLSKLTSIFTASLFIWTPYYLSLIYMRGAFPEFFALSMVPLVFWAITRLIRYKNLLYFIVSTAILSVLFLSHTLTSGMTIGLMVLYISYLYFFEKGLNVKLQPAIGSVVLAGLLTAFHWLPAIASTGLINSNILISGDFAYFNNFPTLGEIVNLFSNKAESWKSLGIMHVGIIMVAIVGFRDILNRLWTKRVLALGAVILILLFLTLSYSDFFWNTLPAIKYLQFPSRLLGPIGLLTALLAGVLIEAFIHNEKIRQYTIFGFLALMLGIYWPLVNVAPNRFEQEKNLQANDLNVYDYLDKTIFTAQDDAQPNIFFDRGVFSFEYLPRIMPIEESRILAGRTLTEANERFLAGESPRFTKIETDDENISIEIIKEEFVNFEYKIIAEEAGIVRINQFEFPTWEILLNSQLIETIIEQEEIGQLLNIPQGTHTLSIKFKHLPITIWSRIFSGVIFLLTVAGLVWFKFRCRRPNHKQKSAKR